MSVKLTAFQREVMQKIIEYGFKNGFSNEDINIAIKTAWIESRLGTNLGPPPPTPDNPNPTASGLFQYTDPTWTDNHSNKGEKNNFDNQIKAFYEDITLYKSKYNDPNNSLNIPKDEITYDEYVYINHHDGRNTKTFINKPGEAIWNTVKFKSDVSSFFNSIYGYYYLNKIDDSLNRYFTRATQWVASREPLTLDLDGDGIETVGINTNNPILFDHDADGVKTATGWVKPDDGMLVLDRNNNGVIDNGRELFGDSTQLSAGGTAADGFAALADLNSNGDGVIDGNIKLSAISNQLSA